MPINGCGRPDFSTNYCRIGDPAGLGIPFSPFYDCAPDKFECNPKPADGSKNNDGFTFGKAVGSFFSGVAEPFMQMLRHPIQTLGIAAGLGYVIKKMPVVGKYVAVLGAVVGGIQFLTGFGNAVSGIADGKSKEAEQGFKSMGTGIVSTLLSAFGFKTAKNNEVVVSAENAAQVSQEQNSVGILTKIKNFFNSERKPTTEEIEAKLVDTAREMPGAIATGALYQAPFVSFLYGNNNESKKVEGNSNENSQNNGEPLVMQEAQRVYNNL